MNLRPEQLTQLAQAAGQDFQDRLRNHLQQHFPQQLASLGEDGARRLAQQAIEQARAYGMKTEQDIAKYADIMSAFGCDFDRNAATAWASSILNDPSLTDAGAKVNRLAQEALAQARALEAQRKELEIRGRQALDAAAAVLSASAQDLSHALDRAAEDFFQNVAGSIVQGCQLPAPPEDLCMGKGFADPKLIEDFVKDFKSEVAEKWDNLKPEERFEAVKKLQEKQFKDLSIPVPDISRSLDEAAGWLDPSKVKAGEEALFGLADPESWGMTLNGHIFEKSPLSELDQKELAKTLLHESRHFEQAFKAAQLRAAEGMGDAMRAAQSEAEALRARAESMAADAMRAAQSEAEALRAQIEGEMAEAMRMAESATHKALDIPRAVAEEAVRNPLPQVSEETGALCANFKKAKEWNDGLWGKGGLSQWNLPYEDQPWEKDAFALEDIIDSKW